MKITNKLKIGGFEWTIKENAEVAYEGNIYGTTHHTKQEIFLDPNMPQTKKEHTLLHEILHAIWWQAGLDKRYKDKPEIQEEIVSALSFGLHQVLKDNNLLN